MQKENAEMVSGKQVEKPDRFNSKFDLDTHRISYDYDIREHFSEELQFIAGVLDMLVVLGSNELIGQIGDESIFVLMDARNRATELGNLI